MSLPQERFGSSGNEQRETDDSRAAASRSGERVSDLEASRRDSRHTRYPPESQSDARAARIRQRAGRRSHPRKGSTQRTHPVHLTEASERGYVLEPIPPSERRLVLIAFLILLLVAIVIMAIQGAPVTPVVMLLLG